MKYHVQVTDQKNVYPGQICNTLDEAIELGETIWKEEKTDDTFQIYIFTYENGITNDHLDPVWWKMSNQAEMNIKKGQIVKIVDGGGWIAQGPVISACNYGFDDNPDWYIEIDSNDPQADIKGYAYWKQSIDGGEVTNV